MKFKRPSWTESFVESVKIAAIRAISSDPELSQQLILKGGNALELAYKISTRASLDLDYSLEGTLNNLQAITERLGRTFASSLAEINLAPIEFAIKERPENLSPELKDFWGGYQLTFKIVQLTDFHNLTSDPAALKARALSYERPNGRQTFQIDISCHEYCGSSTTVDVDGYNVSVYSPQAIVCEKLRAICQQSPEYGPIVKRNQNRTGRARDFVDIHDLVTKFNIDATQSQIRNLLRSVFAAKRVPLAFLAEIKTSGSLHESDFRRVLDTVRPGVTLLSFPQYFRFVCTFCDNLDTFWNK